MKEFIKCTGWALGGGAVGALLVYLTAPASGTETRRRIRRRVEDEKDHLLRVGQRSVEHAAEYFEKQLKDGKTKLAQVVSH